MLAFSRTTTRPSTNLHRLPEPLMRQIIALFACFTFSCAAHCAPPSEASIHTLLAVTKTDTVMDTLFVNMEQSMRQSMMAAIPGEKLSAQQMRILDAAPAKFIQVMREEMNWPRMRPIYIQIYQESFTQEEINGLIAFYQSPAGEAFVRKMPVVMEKSMSIMQVRMAPMMEKMKAIMAQSIAEAKAAK
ncbi:MAG: DUF2059 domain-containing protein [Polaromonas sp.]|uniref:DUF2059 domain-containing protein n=1 Tax=Polaromonas sp. TaxID=1869339 RepID=UPI0017ACC5FD|nr:DUF2059 domain-containing protein [Polaromonas sp.]MBA3592658.1 DUF2059 domain-containing protein [Polaromonas sp.]